ncbi:hypothetical protein GYH30_014711 [Glycine max]|uniref:Uncharacterized protein n=1 Tax=Glycine max TaxID=3847 RepID=A0A0R0JQE1_SOYBN|nr:hypothetical protein GYH30_014711 [Glycine max]
MSSTHSTCIMVFKFSNNHQNYIFFAIFTNSKFKTIEPNTSFLFLLFFSFTLSLTRNGSQTHTKSCLNIVFISLDINSR